MDDDDSTANVVDGVPQPAYCAEMFWAVTGGFLVVAGLTRLVGLAVARHRRAAAASGREPFPALPRLVPVRIATGVVSVGRQVAAYTPLTGVRAISGRVPALGRILVVMAYFGLIMGLCFYHDGIRDPMNWDAASLRAGWLAIAQLPLIVALACKRIFVLDALTGLSYVSLNFYHRWVARGTIVLATIHMGLQLANWARYDFIAQGLASEVVYRYGVGAFGVLGYMAVLTAARPLRRRFFELFYLNHFVAAVAFLVVLAKHLMTDSRVYVWGAVGIWAADMLFRSVAAIVLNLRVSRRGGLRFAADVVAGDRTVRLEIPADGFALRAGQHVRLTFPTVRGWQTHPFTVASLPALDGKMSFVVRAKRGLTRVLRDKAVAAGAALPVHEKSAPLNVPVIVDGPFGGPARDLKQFDSVLLVVAGVGASFAVPVLRDILAATVPTPTRRVHMVWIVRSQSDVDWYTAELGEALALATQVAVTVDVFYSKPADGPAPTLFADAAIEARPRGELNLHSALLDTVLNAQGESAVAVCGGARLSADVSTLYAKVLEYTAAGTGGCPASYLHTESFEE
ncbi:uncharacterized protein V1510DRAFT_305275 [Dipodascopsis tothii]|uniref:uncharacterized protein n=1 Tax=Dipodascopsis tothii TaxID=44089 RepID=UPI0034CEECA5